MSDLEHPPYGDHIAVPGPVEQLDSHGGPPPATGSATVTDLLPPAEPPRRTGRTLVAATLAVLLVLVTGGAAYGWTVLQRPDVQLARAFDATRSAADGSMTVTVTATGKAAAGAAQLTGSSLRYAWSPGTEQLTVVYDGRRIGTVTTTDSQLIVQLDPAALPQDGDLAGPLGAFGILGGGADVVPALLDGRPVGIPIGPGSALQKALDAAQSGSTSGGSSELLPDQVSKVLDSLVQAVEDDVTVTEAGSDGNGTHYVATLPLAKVADTAWKDVTSLVPGGLTGVRPDLSRLDKVTLSVDVWVRDGAVTRVEVPLGQVLPDLSTGAEGDVRVVVVMGTDGVTPVQGPVTEVPDSLIGMLTGSG